MERVEDSAPGKWLCRAAVALAKVWERLQVELNGQYSLGRLQDLLCYYKVNESRRTRTLGVLLLTPLPSLSIVLLADSLPLNPPSDGTLRNGVFWLRAWMALATASIAINVLLSRSTPMLPMTATLLIVISLITTTAGIASIFGLSFVIGFPVPFSQVLCSPMYFLILFVAYKIQWGAALQANPTAQHVLAGNLKVYNVQMALLCVYPVYNYIFQILSGVWQALFSLMLHVIKIWAKNMMSRHLIHMEDLRPEAVTLTVEMFSALFTVFSMQNASSILTTLVLILADVAHSYLALHDTAQLSRELEAINSKLAATGWRNFSTENKAEMDMLSGVMSLISQHGKEHSRRRLSSLKIPTLRPSIKVKPVIAQNTVTKSSSKSKKPWKKAKVNPNAPSLSLVAQLRPQNSQQSQAQERQVKSTPAKTREDAISKLEQQFIQKSQKLLHLTEFIILIEYIEVVIPAAYCFYLLAMSRMSNRAYYPTLASMDDEKLRQTIINVALYSILELLSFIALSTLLKRRLRLSATLQLAFVLEKQLILVQSKLILWLVYLAQASLEHFGAAYTFRFEWLHGKSADPKL